MAEAGRQVGWHGRSEEGWMMGGRERGRDGDGEMEGGGREGGREGARER